MKSADPETALGKLRDFLVRLAVAIGLYPCCSLKTLQ